MINSANKVGSSFVDGRALACQMQKLEDCPQESGLLFGRPGALSDHAVNFQSRTPLKLSV